jgi:uncharacterized protein YceH (UPF0502 family)
MNRRLSLYEARVIGVLIEKEHTTPDQYPLSLNALTNACNQKSNREPVLDLKEAVVQQTVDGLIKRYLVSRASGFGTRVTKYQHRFCNTEFGDLRLSPQEVAVICELLLRGPQTPGELRSRADRITPLSDVTEVERILEHLMALDEPLVAKLPREAGKRESRYLHCFSDEPIPERAPISDFSPQAPKTADGVEERLEYLEERVANLERLLERVRNQLETLAGPID